MSSFEARLHLPGHTKIPSNVEIDVTDDRVVVFSGGQQLADWAIAELDVVADPDGFRITVDDEEMVINAFDATGLARELGVAGNASTSTQGGRTNGGVRRIDSASTARLRYEEVISRIERLVEMLAEDDVPPEQVFSQWLKLLKEINRRHGDGSMPLHYFYELNTQLLDLIPEPAAQK